MLSIAFSWPHKPSWALQAVREHMRDMGPSFETENNYTPLVRHVNASSFPDFVSWPMDKDFRCVAGGVFNTRMAKPGSVMSDEIA